MENKFLNNSNTIIFRRSRNPIKGLWHFLKNDLVIWQTSKYKNPLILLFALLFGFLIYVFIIAGIILYLIPLVLVFVLFELTMYFLATKLAKIYKTNEVVLSDNDIVFPQVKLSYQDIQKISYSSRIATIIIGGFFSRLLFFVAYYLRYFIIEYRDNTGKTDRLFIPLDLICLPDFLRRVIEKAGLTKVQKVLERQCCISITLQGKSQMLIYILRLGKKRPYQTKLKLIFQTI